MQNASVDPNKIQILSNTRVTYKEDTAINKTTSKANSPIEDARNFIIKPSTSGMRRNRYYKNDAEILRDLMDDDDDYN